MPERAVVVIGVGNELRGDDGAGIEAARRLRRRASRAGIEVREHQGEPTALLDAWEGSDVVVLVDAMRSGAEPGTIRRFDASRRPLPVRLREPSSTHALALDQAIELGRAVGRLPEQLIVLAVEGRTFQARAGLSAELAAAVPGLANTAWRIAVEAAQGFGPRDGGPAGPPAGDAGERRLPRLDGTRSG